MIRVIFVLVLLSLLCLAKPYSCGGTTSQDTTGMVRTTGDLELAIRRVIQETNTPAVGIALVNKKGPVWIAGLGKANIEEGIDADENTLFRVASVSKMFVALAILKLQEEGKLNLEDKIRDRIPEIAFENRWEATHPVRIVHLLEHTTGWDEIHLVESGHNDPTPMSLKEGLDFHPHSRICRWVPGTRKAYSNSGYAVAAFIVEKITGMRYEDYIKENFFGPLKMGHTTFFNDEVYQTFGAVAYNKDQKPLDYANVNYRPAGAMNSSPREMANLVRLLLNRGSLDTVRLISKESILRMEIPQSTPGAKAGLQLGYGLANTTSLHNGFVYHGHDGGIDGGLAELAYLPEYGIGHVLFVNSSRGDGFSQISKLIRDFETGALTKLPLKNEPAYSGELIGVSGYYVPINPRIQGGLFLDQLFGIERIEANKNLVTKSWIFSRRTERFIPVSDSTFRTDGTDQIGMVKSIDPLAGNVLYFDKLVMKRIPGLLVFGQLFLVAIWVTSMILGFFLWIGACIRSMLKRVYKGFILCTYPTLTSLMFLIILILMRVGFNNHELLAQPGWLSISLMLFSVLIVISSIGSFIAVYRSRNQSISRFVFWQVAVLSTLHLLVVVYLLWFGVIPIMTWS